MIAIIVADGLSNLHHMIPAFRYHPNPIATGSVKASDGVCRCCGQVRGYIYTASLHTRELQRDSICPWCIADGSAARKFNAMFSDDHPLVEAGVPGEVIEEVTKRTPGYNSWQQEAWLSCCKDACEFHGDAPQSELQALQGDAVVRTLVAWEWRERDWLQFVQHYQPGGNPAVYKFVCRHCGTIHYALDFS
jgi:uncharacterized protein CbrC (UPF0167 family)